MSAEQCAKARQWIGFEYAGGISVRLPADSVMAIEQYGKMQASPFRGILARVRVVHSGHWEAYDITSQLELDSILEQLGIENAQESSEP